MGYRPTHPTPPYSWLTNRETLSKWRTEGNVLFRVSSANRTRPHDFCISRHCWVVLEFSHLALFVGVSRANDWRKDTHCAHSSVACLSRPTIMDVGLNWERKFNNVDCHSGKTGLQVKYFYIENRTSSVVTSTGNGVSNSIAFSELICCF